MLAFQDFMGSCRHSAPHITLTLREPCRLAAPAVWCLPSRTAWSPRLWARLALTFSTEPSQLTRALQVCWCLWLRHSGRQAGEIRWVSRDQPGLDLTQHMTTSNPVRSAREMSLLLSSSPALLQPHFQHPRSGAIMSLPDLGNSLPTSSLSQLLIFTILPSELP